MHYIAMQPFHLKWDKKKQPRMSNERERERQEERRKNFFPPHPSFTLLAPLSLLPHFLSMVLFSLLLFSSLYSFFFFFHRGLHASIIQTSILKDWGGRKKVLRTSLFIFLFLSSLFNLALPRKRRHFHREREERRKNEKKTKKDRKKKERRKRLWWKRSCSTVW